MKLTAILMVSFGVFGQPDFAKTSTSFFSAFVLFLSFAFDEDGVDDLNMV